MEIDGAAPLVKDVGFYRHQPKLRDDSVTTRPVTSGFFAELRRRKVYWVAAAYVVEGGFIIPIASAVFRHPLGSVRFDGCNTNG